MTMTKFGNCSSCNCWQKGTFGKFYCRKKIERKDSKKPCPEYIEDARFYRKRQIWKDFADKLKGI